MQSQQALTQRAQWRRKHSKDMNGSLEAALKVYTFIKYIFPSEQFSVFCYFFPAPFKMVRPYVCF